MPLPLPTNSSQTSYYSHLQHLTQQLHRTYQYLHIGPVHGYTITHTCNIYKTCSFHEATKQTARTKSSAGQVHMQPVAAHTPLPSSCACMHHQVSYIYNSNHIPSILNSPTFHPKLHHLCTIVLPRAPKICTPSLLS